ncbi:DUF3105 domain-containing protein [Embleya sp. NBC_00888]|uniref:DUF3105 domain-containing protein n=1 Tax=Embleya sp. NBC_00888 TaxID=2975960 RepID=UPI00386F19A0|nr:DUF3105 domain-containing protein [Embleya sp. NBC_00888]
MGQQSPNTSKKQSKAQRSARMAATRERVAAQREQERKAAKRRSAIIFTASGIAVIALVAGLTAVVMSSGDDDGDKSSASNVIADVKPDPSVKSDIVGVSAYTASQGHIAKPKEVTYKQIPPVGGEHDPVWQNCGIYDSPIPNRNGVHSLEHGTVWLTYQSNLPADQLEILKSKVKGKTYMMLSPYEGLDKPVVASAWGLQLKLDNASDPRLDQFIKAYKEGKQTPEPGSPCTGGVGKPTS